VESGGGTSAAVVGEAIALEQAPLGFRKDAKSVAWRRRYGLVSLVSSILFVATWFLVTNLGLVSTLFLPSPQMVYDSAVQIARNGQLVQDVLISTERVLIGYTIAACVAIPLGILMGTSRFAKAVVDPVLSLIRPLPSLSWVPLSILWFGIGESQKYAIVFMGTLALMLLYVAEATKRVDVNLILAARGMGADTLRVMTDVVLPGALPGIISGLKISLAASWTVVLSAEMVAATNGLGALIWFGRDWNNLGIIFVGMAMISLTVFVIDILVRSIEDRILPWERSRQRR
jgi:taurine transport system permease protein